jgi:ribokinase
MRCFGAYDVMQVDATAAGDAFTAALALRYVETGDIGESIPFASACAAISVTRPGAVPSMPSRREVEDFVTNNSLRRL